MTEQERVWLPPLRLVVGSDALAAVSRMLAGRLNELEAYRSLTLPD